MLEEAFVERRLKGKYAFVKGNMKISTGSVQIYAPITFLSPLDNKKPLASSK